MREPIEEEEEKVNVLTNKTTITRRLLMIDVLSIYDGIRERDGDILSILLHHCSIESKVHLVEITNFASCFLIRFHLPIFEYRGEGFGG